MTPTSVGWLILAALIGGVLLGIQIAAFLPEPAFHQTEN